MLDIILSVLCFLSFCGFVISTFIWFKVKRISKKTKTNLTKKKQILLIFILVFAFITILTFLLYTFLMAQ